MPGPPWRYVTPEDEAQYADFVRHYMSRFAPIPIGPLYHYTTGEGLIAIAKSGKLWSTQIACLNDAKEFVYTIDEIAGRVRKELAERAAKPNHAADDIDFLLSRIEHGLVTAATQTEGVFVCCFSEDGDDLSQWRAYSGGEGGYAIEFDARGVRDLAPAHNSYLLRVEYDPRNHDTLIGDMIKWTKHFFADGLAKKRAPSREEWSQEFLECWTNHIRFFVPCIKHPTFSAEREWRVVHYFQDADIPLMEYRQRQSMMTRHVPLSFGAKLPVTGVRVGPARHKELSKVGAGDLLRTHGYGAASNNITETAIPYRTP